MPTLRKRLAPEPASFAALVDAARARLAQLAAQLLSIGGSDPAQSRREALAAIGRALRDESSVAAYGDHLALIGASLVLLFGIALYLINARHLGAAPG